MRTLACNRIAAELRSKPDLYLLIVAEGCPFCEQVLDQLGKQNGKVHLVHDTIVVNSDSCGEELDKIVDFPATPMLAHYRNGKEIRRAVGLDEIYSFGDTDASGGSPAAARTEVTSQPVQAPAASSGREADNRQGPHGEIAEALTTHGEAGTHN